MSEYWKSTPSYWCKFCAIYVRDSSLERKNHEASAKHQNSIQRNLRELQKGKQREDRDKQRAVDEVARLNGLVSGSGKAGSPGAAGGIIGAKEVGKATAAPPSIASAAAQRKAHAEQLAAMGVQLPDDLKREVTGVGNWQVLSERIVDQPTSLADIKSEQDSKEDVKDAVSRGVHKRKAEDEEEEAEAAYRRRAWGTNIRTYPGTKVAESGEDLDALLSGVTRKKLAEVKKEELEDAPAVKHEGSLEEKPLDAVPDVDAPAPAPVKQDENDDVPAVVFKKRKAKK
ncbi:hypothetical protein LTR85_003381 [Meristemomyces frigidus]|nr:hypothetical protein LTR85_003381 [Meristemomyces frigidus]